MIRILYCWNGNCIYQCKAVVSMAFPSERDIPEPRCLMIKKGNPIWKEKPTGELPEGF